MPTTDLQSPDLADRLAALWGATVQPQRVPNLLPPLPPPLRCELDHGNPANWKFGPDRYNRTGFRRVTCKSCGKFYGYQQAEKRPKRKGS